MRPKVLNVVRCKILLYIIFIEGMCQDIKKKQILKKNQNGSLVM